MLIFTTILFIIDFQMNLEYNKHWSISENINFYFGKKHDELICNFLYLS